MPNPLDRGPSSTPEAGSFTNLGVENVSAEGKVLGEGVLPPPTSLPAGHSFKDYPNLVKTRELLEDRYLDYGLYSEGPDDSNIDNSLVEMDTLVSLHEEAELTWQHIEGLVHDTKLHKDDKNLLLGSLATQRELTPSYALLTNSLAERTSSSLSLLRSLSIDTDRKFIRGARISSAISGRTVILTGDNFGRGIHNHHNAVSFSGNNSGNGVFDAHNSVSFTGINNDGYGCDSTERSVSFSRQSDLGACRLSIRSAGLSLDTPNGGSGMISKSWNCLAVTTGDALPPASSLFMGYKTSEQPENNLIIIEDREKKAGPAWLLAAKDSLTQNEFSGALIVGGVTIYDERLQR